MPIYEFSCDKCSCQFEELVLGEPKEINCPQCGSPETHKLISRCRSKLAGSESLGAAPSLSGG